MSVSHVSMSCLPACITEPFSYGKSLLHRASTGTHPFLKTPLSLAGRIVCVIKGLAYITPLIGTIIWIAHQFFGSSQTNFASKLTTDWFAGKIKAGSALRSSKTNKSDAEILSWDIRRGFNVMTVIKTKHNQSPDPNRTVRAVEEKYTYDWSGVLQRYSRKESEGISTQSIKIIPENNQLKIGQLTCLLKKPLPWIQETAFGLSPFVLSNQRELHFYEMEIDPGKGSIEPFCYLVERVAVKQKEELVQGLGTLLKVTISTAATPSEHKGTLWFNPRSGELLKSVIVLGEGELVKTHLMRPELLEKNL